MADPLVSITARRRRLFTDPANFGAGARRRPAIVVVGRDGFKGKNGVSLSTIGLAIQLSPWDECEK
jgi:hypothetical protein